jgi:hypothetical protein
MNIQYNALLENLQERVVQEEPLQLIHETTLFKVFDKGIEQKFSGAFLEWVGDQPLEGVEWNKKLKSADLDDLPEVFGCRLGIFLNKVYYTIYNEEEIQQALQSPEMAARLVFRLTDSLKTKPVSDLNKKVVEIICNKDNYNAIAWQEITEDEAIIDSLDKAVGILKIIKKASNAMLEPSSDYNKGYQKPGTNVWNKVTTNCESRKTQVLTIDPDWLDDLEIHFLSDVGRDSELNPYKIFKDVVRKKLDNGVKCALHDEKSVAYKGINQGGIQTEKVFGSFNTKFGYRVKFVGGMLPFTNSWALVKKEKGKATASGSK